MPKFRVTSPDGTTYEVNAPEGATQQDAIAYVQANSSRIPKAETSVLRDVGGALVRGAGQIVSLPGQLYGLATGDMDNISTRAGQSVEQFGEELQTAAFRERQRQVDLAQARGEVHLGGDAAALIARRKVAKKAQRALQQKQQSAATGGPESA